MFSSSFQSQSRFCFGTWLPLACLGILLLLILSSPGVEAVHKSWTAASGQPWFDVPDNWFPVGVPGPGDYVNLTAAPGFLVAVRQTHVIEDIEFSNPGTMLDVQPGGQLEVTTSQPQIPANCETISISG